MAAGKELFLRVDEVHATSGDKRHARQSAEKNTRDPLQVARQDFRGEKTTRATKQLRVTGRVSMPNMCVSMLRVCVRRFAKRTAAVKSRIVNVAEGRERENPLNNF